MSVSAIKISNIAQLPSALRAGAAGYFDTITGDVKPAFWSTPGDGSAVGTYYGVENYEFCSPTEAPYTPPPPPPEPPAPPSPALVFAIAQRDAAKVALEIALENYLAIVSPGPSDRDLVTAAEKRLADCSENVTLLTPSAA